jgi:hypothetical protein
MDFLKTLDIETIVLAFGTLLFLVFLVKWHVDSENDLDIRSAFMKDGKLSLAKSGQALALIVSTWVLIYQTRNNRLTDWLFTGYMVAWSGANMASKYLDTKNPQYTSGSSYSNSPYGNSGSSYSSGPRQTRVSVQVDDDEPPLHENEAINTSVPGNVPLDFRSRRNR